MIKNHLSILFLVMFSMTAKSQTSGPSSPEVQKFTPSSSRQMVNLFSGDLNYNINLLELDGGYPVNLSYTSGAGMAEEASSVGLGWQLNIGRINRMVRGLPDDFNGEKITKKMFQLGEWNIGLGVGVDAEAFGLPFLRVGATAGLSFSNVRGIDLESSLSASIAFNIGGAELSGGLTLGMSSKEGASITPNAGLRYGSLSLNAQAKISSMEGLKYLSFNANLAKMDQVGYHGFSLVSAKNTFTPRIDFPVSVLSGSFKYRIGAEIWGISPGGTIYGQFSVQSHPQQVRTPGAYGYLYMQNYPNNDAVMDLGSEKETPVFQEDPNLSFSYLASDVFSVSAQGLSGSFRPFRKDMGIAHNETLNNTDVGGSLGLGIHSGGYFQGDLDITANVSNSYSGEWRDNNQVLSVLRFKTDASNSSVYFKNVGETNLLRNRDIFENLGGTAPARFDIGESELKNVINGQNLQAARMIKKDEATSTSFLYLTAEEAQHAGLPMSSYSGFGKETNVTPVNRYDESIGIRKPHHISAIMVTKEDDTTYEFGIAAYNIIQKEISFNINGKPSGDQFKKITGYTGLENSSQNPSGRNHIYTVTETPAYAYAYLLTAVYSADYVDLTRNGPTPDDMGNYTRFNYTRTFDNFKWRTPYDSAAYQPGNLCDRQDDMANYVYGEKEIWTIHSIETKNFVAEFHASERDDATEVAGENGGINDSKNAKRLPKIDNIQLFSRAEYKNVARVAIKSVYFNYNYALCKGIPASITQKDSASGKLTLKQLSYSYDKSVKEKYSNYKFYYNNETEKARIYNESLQDRWGTFKKPDLNSLYSSNIRNPYTNQIRNRADLEAGYWQLNSITLPAGGEMNISYEAKDYAYVQDKRAMQMFKLVGFSKKPGETAGNKLYKSNDNYNCMVVDIGQTIDKADLQSLYVPGEKIYVNALVSIDNKEQSSQINREEISGYFEIDNVVLLGESSSQVGIILKEVNGSQAIARALWQKMRKSLTHILNPPVVEPGNGIGTNIMNVVKAVPGQMIAYLHFLDAYERVMKENGRGQTLDSEVGSFVRLYNPFGRKLGGGSRVREITINDNWNTMTGNSSPKAVYGQHYNYEKEIMIAGKKKTISSGVAAWEPVGNEENPFIVPAGEFNTANALAPELYYYKTEPFGESFFPAPSVGYSVVKVQDLHDPQVTTNTTGFESYEFYTTRDFPTITGRTDKAAVPVRNSSLGGSEVKLTASQGFSVELNDMNGKPKSHKIYSRLDGNTPISGTEYIYKTVGGKLDNNVQTINPATGKISHSSLVGIDYDFNITAMESRSLVQSPTMQPNVDVIPAIFGIPFPIPSFFSVSSTNLVQYRGVTTSKIIYRTGLIDSVITYDNGTRIAAKNVLYDESSGEVVVTATGNDYNEPFYNTKIPAHWLYPSMGLASQNLGKIFTGFRTSVLTGNTDLFEGDQLLLVNKGRDRKIGWVYNYGINQRSVIDAQGTQLKEDFEFAKIIRSGKKNLQSLSAGQIVTKTDPTLSDSLDFLNVIDASATEYASNWQAYFGIHPPLVIEKCKCDTPNVNKIKLPSELEVNEDGVITHPSGVTINGAIIKMQDKSCQVVIQLDKAIGNLPERCKSQFQIRFDSIKPVNEEGYCNSSFRAKGIYSIRGNCPLKPSVIQEGTFTYTNDCKPTIICTDSSFLSANSSVCNIAEGVTVNPYLLGMADNWKPSAGYHYVTDRKYKAGAMQKDQGIFNDFSLCLSPPEGFGFHTPVDKTTWQRADQAVIIDPHGKPLESLDALQLPKSSQLGYGYNLPVAEAANAHYYEIAFDGFEDYDYLKLVEWPLNSCALKSHFKFENIPGKSALVDSVSHTGIRSLLVAAGSPVSLERDVAGACTIPFAKSKPAALEYKLQQCDVIRQFAPVPGKSYLASCWIKETRSLNQLDSSYGRLKFSFINASGDTVTSYNFRSKGIIVDDWQQLSEEFKVPEAAQKICLQIVSGDASMFIDDIRIQPFNSTMKSYVYDPVKLKMMAVLDEQNFATFYEYDNEGMLTRTKKETEHGIMTIQEVRSAKPKTGIK